MRKASKPEDWGLNGHDRRRLTMALRRAQDARTCRRLQAVLGVAQGLPPEKVAGLCGMDRRSVYRWVHRYRRRHRPEDLADAPRRGRPRAARAITPRRLTLEFNKDPMSLGYAATGWTVPLLARHLEERYQARVSPRTLRRRMKALGLAWKRPRYLYRDRAVGLPQKKGALSAA